MGEAGAEDGQPLGGAVAAGEQVDADLVGEQGVDPSPATRLSPAIINLRPETSSPETSSRTSTSRRSVGSARR